MNRRGFLTTMGAASVSLLAVEQRALAGEATSKTEASPYKARLRYYIGEEFDIPKRTRAVAAFCNRVGIDGVMMLSAAHEHQPWILSREEYVKRAVAMGEAAKILRQHGLAVEIDVAVTYGHGDFDPASTGKPFPFKTMVDISGAVANGVPCPLDPNFLAHVADHYAELVRQVRPDVIYANDDFRMTNHAPSISIGCFCPLHLKKFADVTGKASVSIEEARSLFEERPDKLERRKLYTQVMEEGMFGVVRAIRKAIDEVAPATRFGIMTSSPSLDRLTGKPYDRLAKAAAGATRPIVRPNLGMYRDGERRMLPAALDATFWTASVAGDETEFITEVDGQWPHSRFFRSAATIVSNVIGTTFWGVKAQSFFLYGFLESPFDEDPEYGDELQRHHAMFKAIARLVEDCRPVEGVRLWYDHDRSVFCKRVPVPSQGGFMTSREWISRLALNGLPIAYGSEGPAVLQGDEGYAITEDQLRKNLKQGMLLDTTAAKALLERGLGEWIGLEAMQTTVAQVTTEHLDIAEFAGSYYNRKIVIGPGFIPNNGFHRLTPRPGARAASTLLELDAKPIGPGMLVFENKEGGRAAVMAYEQYGDAGAVVFVNYGRQAQLRAVLEWLGRKPLPVAVEHKPDLWVMIRRHSIGNRAVIMAANLSFDPLPKFALTVGSLTAGEWKTSRLQPNGALLPLSGHKAAGAKTTISFASRIEPQEAAIFVLDRVSDAFAY